MKGILIRLPDDIKESIQIEANKKQMTMNAYVSLVLRAHKKVMNDIEKTMGGK